MIVPDIPHIMLITLMDRYGLKSQAIKQRWSDAYKYWLQNEMRVYHMWHQQRIMDIVYLRVAHICEPHGQAKDGLGYAAAVLAQQYTTD